jgi:hypothetical protein
LKALEREASMRRSVYPSRVAGGKMSQAQADEETAAMEQTGDILRKFALILKPLQDAAKLDRGPKKEDDDFIPVRWPRHLVKLAAEMSEVDENGQGNLFS